MDSLCLKSGIPGITPSIPITATPSRATQSRVRALGQRSLFSRFSFRYPLRSLWPRRTGSGGYNGLAMDDAVLVEKTDTQNGIYTEEEGEGQNNGNWVFNICHANFVWRNNASDDEDKDEEEKECDACRVDYDDDDDDEEEVRFDRDLFSRMLRRVSLSEARLYAKMSHLGDLAYNILDIKVNYIHPLCVHLKLGNMRND